MQADVGGMKADVRAKLDNVRGIRVIGELCWLM